MTNIELKDNGIDILPTTLNSALCKLQKDDVIKKALGNHLFNNFVEGKKLEWNDYRKQVSEWERQKYFEMY